MGMARGALPRFVLALTGLALIGLLSGCEEEKKPAPKPQPVKVSYVTVAQENVPITVDFVAQTQSSQQVQIYSRINGFLDSREYEEGALVKAGDVLFKLDQKPQIADLEEAKAALQKEKAALEVAKANLARVEPLSRLNALSKKDLDDARGRADMAAAAVDQAQAVVDRAALNLSYTVITSPIDGFAAQALQQTGTYISPPNSQLTTVSLVSPMWVALSVSQNQLSAWQTERDKGTLQWPERGEFAIEMILPNGDIFPKRAKLTFTAPSFNQQTGTFLVRGTFDNPQAMLRPNEYVTARVLGFTRPDAIRIPQRAVHQGQNGHFVWVIDQNGEAQLRPVSVGDWFGDDWFISEGLHPGEKVIVDGLVFAPGTKVEAQPLAATAAN